MGATKLLPPFFESYFGILWFGDNQDQVGARRGVTISSSTGVMILLLSPPTLVAALLLGTCFVGVFCVQ